jgi:hypothetical protein
MVRGEETMAVKLQEFGCRRQQKHGDWRFGPDLSSGSHYLRAQGTGTGKSPESRSPELGQPSGASRTTSSAKNVIAAIRIFMLAFASTSVVMGHHPVL